MTDEQTDAPRRRPTSEERNAAVRATIEPLAPGERPAALKVAAAVLVLLALTNLLLMIPSDRAPVGTGEASPVGRSIGLAIVLAGLAAWIWARSAAALLIFEALLIVTMLYAFLGLLTAANASAVVASAVVLGLAGTLFWKLIRVVARIQAPVHDDLRSS